MKRARTGSGAILPPCLASGSISRPLFGTTVQQPSGGVLRDHVDPLDVLDEEFGLWRKNIDGGGEYGNF